ncbi:MAG: type II secretion system F family protein, partial [Candidatus Margulisiibacteriota bacterium]
MSRYKYKARNSGGALVQGEIESSSSRQLSLDLSQKGLVLVSAEEKSTLFDFSGVLPEFSKVKLKDLSIVFRQLSVVVSAGVPLFEALTALEEQASNSNLKKILFIIRSDIESGSSFSAALKKHASIFSPTVVAMVEAGEKSGTLGEVLTRISVSLEKESQFESKVKASLRYPMIVFTVLICAFFLSVFFIIPRFSSVFAALKSDLPLPTKILLWISSFSSKYWLIIIVSVIAAAFVIRRYLKTKRGKMVFDTVVLKLPVFGGLATKLSLSRFFRMFSDLLESGIPASSALELTADTTGNSAISEQISGVKIEVMEVITIYLAI